MPETKKATVVSFQKEQGFGKVAVEGTGELAFDATVSLAQPQELTPGANVNVEVGPSRIPGRLKVTKLWLASGSSEPARSKAQGPDESLHVGPYELKLPSFWHDKERSVRETPGLFAYNGAAGPGVPFDFLVLAGAAEDLEQKENLVAAYIERHKSPRYTTNQVAIEGAQFEAHQFEGSASLGDGVAYELYVGAAFGDRLVFGFGIDMADAARDSLRILFKTMVGGAIIRRGYAQASAK